MKPLRFDGRVALVTGAGRGLGRAYALELARRGARVVVNDPGVSIDGVGQSDAATEVVEAIRDAGGEAIAHHGSVVDPRAAADMVSQAWQAFGALHIVINNAGILRDKTFAKKDLADFHAVIDVHLWGTVNVTRAAWPLMLDQGYGRVLVTTSGSGILGNFGQSDYATAKTAVLGFMNCLAIEGGRKNVRINAIKPAAATRMAQGVVSDEVLAKLRPELIVPAALYLVTEDAPTGCLIQASGGYFSKVSFAQTPGVELFGDVSVESFAAAWRDISEGPLEPVRHQETA